MSDAGYTECPDCHATPYNLDQRVITGSADGKPTVTFHKKSCPHYDDPHAGSGEKSPRLRLVRPDEEPTT